MDNEKRTYYVSVIGTGEIITVPDTSPWQFKIEATEEEIRQLRTLYNENYFNGIFDFFRAVSPFIEYHHDMTNDIHDENLNKVYRMIYELGDQDTKSHIEGMGIIE